MDWVRARMLGPICTCKLMHIQQPPFCTERAQGLCCRLGVAEHCFGFLAFDSPNNHVHNIVVCTALIRAGAVPAEVLASHNVPAKVLMLGLAALLLRMRVHIRLLLTRCTALCREGMFASALSMFAVHMQPACRGNQKRESMWRSVLVHLQ